MLETPWIATSHSELIQRAREWLYSQALTELLHLHNGPEPRRLAELLQWTAATWDTRRGRERQDVQPAGPPPPEAAAFVAAADQLGLRGNLKPSLSEYDAIIVLGGAVTGNAMRSALAEELVSRGADARYIVGLATNRPLGENELATAPEAAADETEARHLERHLRAAFHLPAGYASTEAGGRALQSWSDAAARAPAQTNFRFVSAPASSPEKRATTADAVAFYVERTDPVDRNRLLLVTSGIYVPYQFFAASPALLEAGSRHVEFAGTRSDFEINPAGSAQRIAQELHAAIWAAARLISPSEF